MTGRIDLLTKNHLTNTFGKLTFLLIVERRPHSEFTTHEEEICMKNQSRMFPHRPHNHRLTDLHRRMLSESVLKYGLISGLPVFLEWDGTVLSKVIFLLEFWM